MQYRAVLLNVGGNKNRVESIWFEEIHDANAAGETGLLFYGGETFIIEIMDKKGNILEAEK